MVLIDLNGYLNRYASNWTNFQLKWSILDPNRGIFGNWPMGYWGGGSTLRDLKVPSGIAPLKKYYFKPPNDSVVMVDGKLIPDQDHFLNKPE